MHPVVLCCLAVNVLSEKNLLCKYDGFLDSRVLCTNCLLLKTASCFTVSQLQLSKSVLVEVNLERPFTDLAALFQWVEQVVLTVTPKLYQISDIFDITGPFSKVISKVSLGYDYGQTINSTWKLPDHWSFILKYVLSLLQFVTDYAAQQLLLIGRTEAVLISLHAHHAPPISRGICPQYQQMCLVSIYNQPDTAL